METPLSLSFTPSPKKPSRLTELCQDRGWTAAKLYNEITAYCAQHPEEKLPCKSTVYGWMHGREPKLSQASMLAKIFGVSVEELRATKSAPDARMVALNNIPEEYLRDLQAEETTVRLPDGQQYRVYRIPGGVTCCPLEDK